VFQIRFPISTNFIRFLFHFYLFPALEIDFGGILIWKTCRVGPTCQPAFLITPGPMRQGSSSSWSACRAQHASSHHRSTAPAHARGRFRSVHRACYLRSSSPATVHVTPPSPWRPRPPTSSASRSRHTHRGSSPTPSSTPTSTRTPTSPGFAPMCRRAPLPPHRAPRQAHRPRLS
jgi:hypothetical protein